MIYRWLTSRGTLDKLGFGIVYTGGEVTDPPLRLGAPLGGGITPLYIVIGALSALEHVRFTGVGERVDASMVGALTRLVAIEGFDLLKTMGIPYRTGKSDLGNDPRFRDPARVQNYRELTAEIEGWTSVKTVAECVSALEAMDIPGVTRPLARRGNRGPACAEAWRHRPVAASDTPTGLLEYAPERITQLRAAGVI